MKKRPLFLWLAVVSTSILLSGCGGISKPPATGFSSDSTGTHSINVTISNQAVPFGGNATIEVAVQDAAGNPVPAELLTGKVFFASILGGTFSTDSISSGSTGTVVTNGMVVTRYTAPTAASGKGVVSTNSVRAAGLPSDLPINDEITVIFNGAMAKISVMLYRLS